MKRAPLQPPHEPRILTLLLASLLLLAVPHQILGQTGEGGGEDPPRTVLKRLAYIDVDEAVQVLSMFGLSIRTHREQSTLILRGSPAKIETAIEVLENLDIPNPTKNLSLSISIIAAERQGPNDLPDHLLGVSKQLGELLGYRAFALLDTVVIRLSDRTGSEVAGGLADRRYELGIGRAEVFPNPDASVPATVRLRKLEFGLYRLTEEGSRDLLAGISTNVELEEGQTAVVGKATPAGGDEALVLVVRAEVL